MPFTDDGFLNLSFQYKNAAPTIRSLQCVDALDFIADGNTGGVRLIVLIPF